MLKKGLELLVSIVLMALIGYAIFSLFLSPADNHGESQGDGGQYATDAFFAASLQDEQNVTQALSQYKGKIIVLNFWATWCPPCREEMPELSALHVAFKAKNVTVLGIAIDEMDLVQEFSASSPVQYPLLVAEEEGMAIASQLGNDRGVLPYTVIINAQGDVVKTYVGRITKSIIAADLQSYIQH